MSTAAGEITYREAVREAIRAAMQADERVFLMGEDVGRYGGCYAVSAGLLEEFGEERIRDTPLSELTIVGAGVGAAMAGMRPIVELMTINFSLLALDQVVNTAAAMRHMSGDQFGVPLVIRMASGGGRRVAAQHSHSLEAWYAHVPGLTVLAPATVEDARGMLGPALADPDPVIIVEHAGLYGLAGHIDAEDAPLRGAAVRREGTDVTLVGHGGGLHTALEAAERLGAEGVAAEVIDLRVLRPLDTGTIATSVAKTRRLVVVDEGWRQVGLSAEIAAATCEQAFFELDAPIRRVCGAEVPMPYAGHLEDEAIPDPDDVILAARLSLGRDG